MITYTALHAAKRNGRLVAWLAAMSPAERVEAAEVCATNSARSVSEWLRTFGELVEAEQAAARLATRAALALEERAAQADAAAELAEWRGEPHGYGVCDEPTEDGSPCGCRFALPADPDEITYCPACNSTAILERRTATAALAGAALAEMAA